MGRKEGNPKHGLRYTREYPIWTHMKQRCTNPKNPKYNNYGGRGITVCESWRESFESFYNDMGPSPSRHHSIDRIDNNGNYNKDNCRWATNTEQSRNRRDNKFFIYKGTLMLLTDLVNSTGVNINTFLDRIRKGWGVEAAADTKPLRLRRSNVHIAVTD